MFLWLPFRKSGRSRPSTVHQGDRPVSAQLNPGAVGPQYSRRTLLRAVGVAGATGGLYGLYLQPLGAEQDLLWYSASGSKADEEWSQMFKAATGVTVEFFRIGGVKLTERIEQEVRANQVRCSVMDISIPGLMSEWAKKGMVTR